MPASPRRRKESAYLQSCIPWEWESCRRLKWRAGMSMQQTLFYPSSRWLTCSSSIAHYLPSLKGRVLLVVYTIKQIPRAWTNVWLFPNGLLAGCSICRRTGISYNLFACQQSVTRKKRSDGATDSAVPGSLLEWEKSVPIKCGRDSAFTLASHFTRAPERARHHHAQWPRKC